MYQATVNNGDSLTIEKDSDQFLINGEHFEFDYSEISPGYFHIIKDNQSITAEVVDTNFKEKMVTIKIGSQTYTVAVKDKLDQLLEKMGISALDDSSLQDIKAPMPGLILDILVEAGQEVKKGDQLMILEAMKMENVLKASGDGVIKSIEVSKGQSVEKNQVLINF